MQRRFKLKPEDLDRIKRWYFDDNISQQDISNLLGVSQKTVSNFMRENKMDVRTSKPKSILDMELIRSLYESGMTQAKIAKEVKVGVTTISKAMKRANLNIRASNRYPAKNRDVNNG